jgi:hypothetical protein
VSRKDRRLEAEQGSVAYPSVDQLQKTLAESVFPHTNASKKAAGRALGTLVEVITFYLLRSWGFELSLAIERPLPEYSNEDITHNVEYTLHPSAAVAGIELPGVKLPISAAKICKALSALGISVSKSHRTGNQLLSSGSVIRNACTIANEESSFLVATLDSYQDGNARVVVSRLLDRPFAVVECKRVGLEEGTRKGPQTIEKAKQGAYVARSVSSLQRVRLPHGEIAGVFVTSQGELVCRPYDGFIQDIIASDNPDLLRRFVLTIGVVSNHGNWFTSDDHNKELKVLAQSYDWLLFLTDEGLCQFVCDLVTEPWAHYQPVREAFLASYQQGGGANRFTKVQMAYEADRLLVEYFTEQAEKVQSWFNVIARAGGNLTALQHAMTVLRAKNWAEIHV